MKYIVDILYSSKLSKKYVGRTVDLKQRIQDHNDGRVPFTKRGRPWKIIFYEVFYSRQDAIAEERFLKSGKGRERMNMMLQDTLKTSRVDTEVVKRA